MSMKQDKEKKIFRRFERINDARVVYFHKAIRRHICEKYLNIDPYIPYYAKRWVMGKKKTNQTIASMIASGKPFMVARFGNTELQVVTSVLKCRVNHTAKAENPRFVEWFARMNEGAGFFPYDEELAEKYTDIMIDTAKEVDLLAMWNCYMEDYMIAQYMPKAKLTFLNFLEPWRSEKEWTRALAGKKVLVIHPFEESIQQQYQKRELLFPGKQVLPAFELKTLKAVQTIAGEKDERFNNWFEALDYMYEEALKIDFDIAIIGCGAYGMPLAAKLKKAGKQAIHLGGVTQILFGIKGRRWVDNPRCGVQFNEAWEYPKESETPKKSKVVEDGCYW